MQRLRIGCPLFVAVLGLALPGAAAAASPQEVPAAPGEEAPVPEKPEAEALSLDQVLKLVREQQRLIDRQRETIDTLEQRLEKVEALALASHNRLEELDERPPDLAVEAAVQQRLAELEQTVKGLPEFTEVVSAGEFPGSFRIPGTDAALKIGGQARFTAVHSLDALGTDDRFVTSSIPIEGTEEAGKESRLNLIASPSRLNFDLRTPTGVGAMRAFIEADYAGDGGAFRLRHAFGQWQKFIIGQTWSTFADPEASPDGIDFEGLNAISLFRKAQIRWTHPFSDRLGLSLAAENPAPDVTGAAGVNQIPDFIARLRWEPERERGPLGILRGIGHLQGGLIVRQVRAEPEDQPNTTIATSGFGANVSGRLSPGWWNDKDDVTLAVYGGKGIGGYINDLGTLGGQDAVYNPETNSLEALPVYSAYVGYQHWWSETLRSTATWGWVFVDNVEIQEGSALRETFRFSVNLAWSPIPRIDLVGEFLAGQRRNKDGQRGRAQQFQFGTRFRF